MISRRPKASEERTCAKAESAWPAVARLPELDLGELRWLHPELRSSSQQYIGARELSPPTRYRASLGGLRRTGSFRAFAGLPEKAEFEIVCVGGQPTLEDEFQTLAGNNLVHLLRLTDAELSVAYTGAVALVYPSRYEGFGMPVAEALACGCPVITCRNSSLIEVAGEAALYVGENDVAGLRRALRQVQEPTRRAELSVRGRAQAVQFSWSAMAETVAEEFIAAVDRLRRGDLPRPAPLWRTMRAMQQQLQMDLAQAVESRLAADPIRKRLMAIDAISEESGSDTQLPAQLIAARDLLAGIENSPFWRLRRLVLQTLRPFGLRHEV